MEPPHSAHEHPRSAVSAYRTIRPRVEESAGFAAKTRFHRREGSIRTLTPSGQPTAPHRRTLGAARLPYGATAARRILFRVPPRILAVSVIPALLALAGCGGTVSANPSSGSLTITPGSVTVDTNCTGCNIRGASATYEQFSAVLTGGSTAAVTWTLSGGDAVAGKGSITSSGHYTPPSYLTADSVTVTVTAALQSNPGKTASATIAIAPGFLQPLTPENAALGAGAAITFTGYIAEAGGSAAIHYALSNTASGLSGGQGALGATTCARGSQVFTSCTVTYTAPSVISSTAATFVVATVGSSSSRTDAELLINAAGVDSNPAAHQSRFDSSILLGTSGGNNNDYDTTTSGQIVDCCGGTLGSLIKDSSGNEYLLSNNHVLARSDQASIGETIVQPGLIDDNCAPYNDGGTETPVGVLSGFVKLDSAAGNVDAAIAQVNSGAVSSSGSILELGARQANGSLAAAPPGISSTGGRGETGSVNMTVAKSGRTTGLTCAAISAVSVDVEVSYFTNCDETRPYFTKIYSNQLAISGNQFSDAGDSGSLVVDTGNAEPVGLFFAGGVDASGISQGIANPAPEVLSELSSQVGSGTSYTFVGGADHPVSCLNYGNFTTAAAQSASQTGTLSDAETLRTDDALDAARAMINPDAGILGVNAGKSGDRSGEGAVIVYVDQDRNVAVPQTIAGVRTMVIPTTPLALEFGSAPQSPLETANNLAAAVLNRAIALKQQIARNLMAQNPAFFGVGVGQSLDDPSQAALVIYVDRGRVPAQLPAAISGLRARYIIMDRLHVTRAYATGLQARSRCLSQPAPGHAVDNDPFHIHRPPALHLF
jgi:hypothetical protein